MNPDVSATRAFGQPLRSVQELRRHITRIQRMVPGIRDAHFLRQAVSSASPAGYRQRSMGLEG